MANGRLAELFGEDPDVIDNDILMRTLDLRGAAISDYDNLKPQTKIALDAYVAGINAYIASKSARDLAIEYVLLGAMGTNVTVDPWSAIDSLAVAKLMAYAIAGRDAVDELQRARILKAVGRDIFGQYMPAYDYTRHPTVIKREDLPYRTSVSELDAPAQTQVQTQAKAGRVPVLENAVLGRLRGQSRGDGSNAWVIAGQRSKSGLPILAVDPHQTLEIPNMWHEIGLHLRPKDKEPFNIYGFSAAPLFMILNGNNDRIAWATTNIVGGDSLDLFTLQINPDNPDQYFWDGAYRGMDVQEVTLSIAGVEPRLIRIRKTHFGPVLPVPEGGPVYALRWSGLERGSAMDAALRIPFAKNFKEFRAALTSWDSPPTNFMYADTDGNIGWQEAGLFPIRANGSSGYIPTPGVESATQWQGWIPFNLLPNVKNPNNGFIASGNNAPVPLDYYEWIRTRTGRSGNHRFVAEPAMGFRGARIENLIQASRMHDMASFQSMQNDVTVPGLSKALKSLEEIEVNEPNQNCRDALTAWDGAWDQGESGPLIFAYFLSQFLERVYNDQLPDTDPAEVDMNTLQSFLILMRAPNSPWWNNVLTPELEDKDDILPEVLNSACHRVREEHGADSSAWSWGAAHKARFDHPIFSQIPIPQVAAWGSVEEQAVNGGVGTINSARWREGSGTYSVRHISAYRRIIDLSDLENSLAVNSTGQSSHPASPHYADQTALWAAGQYRTVNWSDDQVKKVAEQRLTLAPLE